MASPIARALIGKSKGETIKVEAPSVAHGGKLSRGCVTSVVDPSTKSDLTTPDATGAGLLTPKPQQERKQQDSGE